jgi:ATP-binding cassette, subfamily C, bacterial
MTTIINFWQSWSLLFSRNPRRVKTPTVLQMEVVECGAAALGIMLGYYGKIVTLPELRQVCGVSRDGSKASNIVQAAKSYGLEAKGLKQELDDLADLDPPYIVFWEFNHFLVVEGFSKKRVYLNDPQSGPRTVSFQEFDEGYTGIVLVMEPSEEFVKGGRNPSTMISLWKRLRGSVSALIYCLVAGFFLTLIGLIVPVFTQIFIDEIVIEQRFDWLRPLIVAMIITSILQGMLTMLRLKYLRRLKLKLEIEMSSGFLWHILRLPASFYAQRFAGEISNRTIINDKVANVLSGQLTTTIVDVIMVIFYALVMVQYDLLLTLIMIAFAAINVLTLRSIGRQRIDANQRLRQEYGKSSGIAIAALQNIETLKASGLESDFFARWSGYYTKAISSQQELGATNQILSVLPILLSALSSMLLLVIGGQRVMDGHLSMGMLIAFQSLSFSFQEPVNNLLSFGSILQELAGDLVRLDDVLDQPISIEYREGQDPSLTTAPKLQGYVELQNVTFGYSQISPPLIENFNLLIKPGQRVALVGGSGSGKSTIAKMISGLYQPWAGEILFDRMSRSEIPRHILTNSVAMVEQEILLFGGTVRDNLTLWDDTISDRSLMKACQDAEIADVILALTGGFDAELLEGGANLSGGQRQRLEIARTLVNNPSILVMDEATSALDAETERTIDGHLRRRGCTCIIIAHRLSTIRDCDEIIVLEHGKVVQRGTHQELWQLEGTYSSLIQIEG